MKKNLFRVLFTLPLLFIIGLLFSQSCHQDGVNENAQYLQLVENTQNNHNRSNSKKEIPVHFFFIRYSSGNPIGGNYNKANKTYAGNLLNEVNTIFSSSNISFRLCKLSFIDNDTFVDLSTSPDPNTGYITEFDQMLTGNNLDEDALCVYVVDNIVGYFDILGIAAFPFQVPGALQSPNSNVRYPMNTNNYVIVENSWLYKEVLAHEIGHYLGVQHIDRPVFPPLYVTHFGNTRKFDSPARPFIRDTVFYANNFYNPSIMDTIVTNWKNSGDFLEDTPPEPAGLCDCDTCYKKDPYIRSYNPIFENVMKSIAYFCDNISFTKGQFDIMHQSFIDYATRARLLNENSTCDVAAPYGYGDKGCVAPNTPKGLKNHIINIYDSSRNKSFTRTMYLDSINDVGVYNLFDIGLEAGSGNARVNIMSRTDNWTDNVSTADLVAMNKHILLLEQFNNPFQYLSGDVTNDGKISTADMVETRKLILRIKDTFSSVHNWRFVPTYFFDPTVCNFTSFNTNPLKAKCYFNIGGDSLSYFPNSQSKTFMDEFTVPLVNTYLRKQSTWNWKAAKSGDVNCNANDTKLIDDNEEKLFLKNLHRCYYTDEFVNFTVKARSEQEVTAWEMGVRLNPDVLEFNALEITNSGTPFDVENFGLTKWNQGQFRALWIDTLLTKINMQNYTELYKLRLKVKQTTCNFDSLFLLSGKVLPTKFYNDTAEIKNVSILLNIEDVNNGNHSQLVKNVYPNPFDKKISIEFELEKEGFAEISLYDNSGRLINNKKEFCNKGINTLTFEDNKGYQQGIIHYVITTKEATQRGTILNTKY